MTRSSLSPPSLLSLSWSPSLALLTVLSPYSPISRGSSVKFLSGMGIFLVTYSQITSILYFSCAEMGMIGAPSATVPGGEATRPLLSLSLLSPLFPHLLPHPSLPHLLTLHKLEYLLVLVLSLCISDQVNLVLQDYDVFQFHDLNGCQMF